MLGVEVDEITGAARYERSWGSEGVSGGPLRAASDGCVLMLLYIVKGFGVLVWLVRGGDGLDPEGGASFEFG